MGVLRTAPCKWTEEKCDEKVAPTSKSGLCTLHGARQYARDKAAEKRGTTAPAVPKKPARAAPPPRAIAPAGDVVQLLEARLVELRAEESRIERALLVLREPA